MERMFECAALREVRNQLAGFAARFDAELLDGKDAAALLKDAAAIENMACAIKAQAAARVDATGVYRSDGQRSAAHQLAREAGITVSKAKAELETAERVKALSATAAAVREGKLSAEQAQAVADAATADPTAEGRLLEH